MPANRWPCPGVGAVRRETRVIWRKLDCLKPNLQEGRWYPRRKDAWSRRRVLPRHSVKAGATFGARSDTQ
jgi:hypothetical protein